MTEAEARCLAEDDRRDFGNGFYRKKRDGSFEYIPADEIVILMNVETLPRSI